MHEPTKLKWYYSDCFQAGQTHEAEVEEAYEAEGVDGTRYEIVLITASPATDTVGWLVGYTPSPTDDDDDDGDGSAYYTVASLAEATRLANSWERARREESNYAG